MTMNAIIMLETIGRRAVEQLANNDNHKTSDISDVSKISINTDKRETSPFAFTIAFKLHSEKSFSRFFKDRMINNITPVFFSYSAKL